MLWKRQQFAVNFCNFSCGNQEKSGMMGLYIKGHYFQILSVKEDTHNDSYTETYHKRSHTYIYMHNYQQTRQSQNPLCPL